MQMKRKRMRMVLFAAVALSALLVLGACGGVSQDDLDVAIAERDQALADLSSEQESATRLREYLSTANADLASVTTELESVSAELETALAGVPEEEEVEAVAATGCTSGDLSYTATEYAHADLGFTVQYDGSFWTAITETDTYWNALDTTMYGITGLYVAWDGDVVEGEGYADFYAGADADAGDTDYVLVSESDMTLCDGTAVTRIEATVNWGGAFDGGITSYATPIDGKWVVVSVVGGPGWAYMDDQADVDEVLGTWTFN